MKIFRPLDLFLLCLTMFLGVSALAAQEHGVSGSGEISAPKDSAHSMPGMASGNMPGAVLPEAPDSMAPQGASPGMQGGMGAMMPPGMMMKMNRLTPEQKKEFNAIFARYEEKSLPLRDKLFGKLLLLRAYRSAQNVSKDDVRGIVDDIVSLRGQLRKERTDLATDLEKAGLSDAFPMRGDEFTRFKGGCRMMKMMETDENLLSFGEQGCSGASPPEWPEQRP